MGFHLAQVNIAWMHGALGDPVMAGLAGRIHEINQLAEQSAGFVWRLRDEVEFEALEPFEADFPGFRRDRFFYNLSVWRTVDDLQNYTFQTAHAEMLNERRQWIDRSAGVAVALWWIPAESLPTIADSAERLRLLRRNGPTPEAFTLRKHFPAP